MATALLARAVNGLLHFVPALQQAQVARPGSAGSPCGSNEICRATGARHRHAQASPVTIGQLVLRRRDYALPAAPLTVTVTSRVRASTWTWKPILFATPPGVSGTVAPPRPGDERMTPVRSQSACGTVTVA